MRPQEAERAWQPAPDQVSLDGVADSRAPVRGHLRAAGWTALAHGLYLPAGMATGPRGLLGRLEAWSLVLPPSGCFTHVTAAAAYGWQLPNLPADVPVFVAMHRAETRPRRRGLVVTRHPAPPRTRRWGPARLAVPAEALRAAARDLGLLDQVLLTDSAVYLHSCDLRELEAAAAGRCRGAPALRRALALVDGRAESAWESVLRVFHVVCEVPVVPQYVLLDPDGGFVARGDLRLAGTRVLHEYDGGVHRDRDQHRHDLARERAIGNIGWTRRGYTAVDLLHKPELILREADAAIGRAHDPRRLEAWYALLRDSSLTPVGRARLRARWSLP